MGQLWNHCVLVLFLGLKPSRSQLSVVVVHSELSWFCCRLTYHKVLRVVRASHIMNMLAPSTAWPTQAQDNFSHLQNCNILAQQQLLLL